MMTKEKKEPRIICDIVKDLGDVQPSGERKLEGKLDSGFQIFEGQLRGGIPEYALIFGQFKGTNFYLTSELTRNSALLV